MKDVDIEMAKLNEVLETSRFVQGSLGADQAHMTREARRFSNCTPTVLLRSAECTLRMSDLFKTGDAIPR